MTTNESEEEENTIKSHRWSLMTAFSMSFEQKENIKIRFSLKTKKLFCSMLLVLKHKLVLGSIHYSYSLSLTLSVSLFLSYINESVPLNK
jgi:hypothetical protein